MSPAGCVLGLDLSLRGSAAVLLHHDWDAARPWERISTERFGDEGELGGQERVEGIVEGILKLCSGRRVGHAFVEEHAFNMSAGKHFVARAELVGAAKHRLFVEVDVEVIPVVASSARKLLFGPLPRMDRKTGKAFIKDQLAKMGSPFPDEDSRDAFLVANAGRHSLGLPCLAHG